jgi:hypothetical protein
VKGRCAVHRPFTRAGLSGSGVIRVVVVRTSLDRECAADHQTPPALLSGLAGETVSQGPRIAKLSPPPTPP